MSSQELMGKLDTLQRIRTKTEDLHSVSSLLKQEVTSLRQEEANMKEYKSELDLLLAEKLHHVEILRQIHSDINMMETVIKQGQQAVASSESRAASLYNEYIPLRTEVHELRTEVGLEVLAEKECDKFQFLSSVSTSRSKQPKRSTNSLDGSLNTDRQQLKPRPATKRSLSSSGQDNKTLLMTESKATLPPMKQCGSCHQYIHRNAPICPLCKAKSRSRNPKKTKK